MPEKYLIQIGESVHASIPKSGAAMKELLALGDGAYEKSSEPLDYIISLITGQVEKGADYIAVNVDAFGEDDPQLAVDLMREYVSLVKKYSKGVPPCIDSSDDNVLKAGLQQWYKGPANDIALPLLNSVKTYTIDNILPLRKKYPFKVVGMLVEQKSKPGGITADDLYEMARMIFAAAVKYGFSADDVFFDTTTFPLAIDLPMEPGTPSFTYRAFEAIRKIKSDPEMKGVHCSLGISNCVKDLPARKIGLCRAYVDKGREYGLDAGIVNVNHQYGAKSAAADLQELVAAFASQDGSPTASMKAMELMGQFCRASKK